MISRILERDIPDAIQLKKVVVLLGAQQVVKTTLLKKIIAKNKNVKVVNGDEPDAIEQLTNLTSDRLKTIFGTTKTLIID
jgi:predicted AAA+ superfamily ATPase